MNFVHEFNRSVATNLFFLGGITVFFGGGIKLFNSRSDVIFTP